MPRMCPIAESRFPIECVLKADLQVELTVLADLLRTRIRELESGHEHEGILARGKDPAAGEISAELSSTKVSLYESQKKQHRIESEISGLEAELADDRDLLDMAAQEGGIGVAEAIRRNKWLKTVLRQRETEIEKCRLELSVSPNCFSSLDKDSSPRRQRRKTKRPGLSKKSSKLH